MARFLLIDREKIADRLNCGTSKCHDAYWHRNAWGWGRFAVHGHH